MVPFEEIYGHNVLAHLGCLCMCVYQPIGALSEAQVLGEERGDLCESGGASAGATAGLQDHHAR